MIELQALGFYIFGLKINKQYDQWTMECSIAENVFGECSVSVCRWEMDLISSSLTHDDLGSPVCVPPAPLSISHMRGNRSHCKAGLYLFSNPCRPSQNFELHEDVFETSWWVFSSRSRPRSLASFVVSGTGYSSTGRSLKTTEDSVQWVWLVGVLIIIYHVRNLE